MGDSGLSRNQKKALAALLEHRTVTDAAEAVGLGRRTITGYLGDPAFVEALRAEQDRRTAATRATLTGGMDKALSTLGAVMDDPEATAAARVRAAVAWLRAWRDAVELDDLAARVAALETANEGTR